MIKVITRLHRDLLRPIEWETLYQKKNVLYEERRRQNMAHLYINYRWSSHQSDNVKFAKHWELSQQITFEKEDITDFTSTAGCSTTKKRKDELIFNIESTSHSQVKQEAINFRCIVQRRKPTEKTLFHEEAKVKF